MIPAGSPLPIRRSKRLADVAICLLLLILLAPLILVVVAAMLLNFLLVRADRGPLFYREPRISRGRLFRILKFRTVRQARIDELREAGRLKTVKELELVEANLTWTGRYLKGFYLDELPQLINILKGDMAFVGPRPWPEADYLAQRARGINAKGVVPCGLTGLVQCNKGKGLNDEQLDLDYIEAYRTKSALGLLVYDAQIVWKSLRTVLEGKGI